MIELDAWPTRAQYRPGEPVALRVVARGGPGTRVELQIRILEGARLVGETRPPEIALSAAGGADVVLAVDLPLTERARAGYAIEIEARSGARRARATTALDVAPHWSEAPRYGFLCDFSPDESRDGSARRVDALLQLHLNVAQFYDWMPSHYRLVPDREEYVDAMGRRLARSVVRRKLDLCHERGIAGLAYGALYGAERDFSEQHRDWLLYDRRGEALHLADRFYLQDISPGSPWREWILREYERVVDELGFDGIHIDQYGFPKRARSRASGAWREVDLASELPAFVEEAARRVLAIRPHGGSIFNCVNAWPLEAMGAVRADAATYIEVWEPHRSYRDLYELARRARQLRPDKPAILAAYLRPFHPDEPRAAGGLRAFRLAFAAIHAAGGSQLVAGEGGALLAEAYYPRYGRLDAAELVVVRRYFDFVTRNAELLRLGSEDLAWTHVGPTNDAIALRHPELAAYGAGARPSSLWTIARSDGRRTVLHLVNLRGLESDLWNASHPGEPDPLEDLEIRVRVTGDIAGAWWDTPDDDVGIARPLESVKDRSSAHEAILRVPRVDTWSAVWWDETAATE